MSLLVKIFPPSDESKPYARLLDVLHEAFRERLQENLNFGCATFNLEDLKRNTENAYVITVNDGQNLLGFVSLTIREKGGIHYGVHEFLSVSPKMKRKGIGSLLFNEVLLLAKKQNLMFISSTTSVKAISSVKWHLKNGFKIFRLLSYPSTNYYSFFFIKVINYNLFAMLILSLRIPIYVTTYLLCKSLYDEQGNCRYRRIFKSRCND